MNASEADRAYVDGVLRGVCDDFDASLQAAADGRVAARFAAVPSWYAIETAPGRPARPVAQLPSWCIDAATARRLLSEIRSGSGSER
jgi:hypothetical protein